jgi:hypothetical protein
MTVTTHTGMSWREWGLGVTALFFRTGKSVTFLFGPCYLSFEWRGAE